jgi:hypothetical protein
MGGERRSFARRAVVVHDGSLVSCPFGASMTGESAAAPSAQVVAGHDGSWGRRRVRNDRGGAARSVGFRDVGGRAGCESTRGGAADGCKSARGGAADGCETIVVVPRAAWGFVALVGGLAGIASAVEVSA